MSTKILNNVMATISSKLDAAINVVGIPLSTPYPFSCKNIQEGTKTAGDTAPSKKPRPNLRKIGISTTANENAASIHASEI
jgi:hypothetical protein